MNTNKNKSLIQRLYNEFFDKWNLQVVDELISPNFICHAIPPELPKGPQGFNQFYSWLRSAFPDIRFTVNDLIAENDKVVVRWTWHCTHTGNYIEIAPTGKKISVDGIAIYRIENDQIVERWVQLDINGMMKQMEDNK